MTASDYQRAAARTLIDGTDRTLTGRALMAVWTALGLAGEAGEVAEHVKKGVLHGHGVDRDALAGELGDVLWYVAGLATVYGLGLSDIMARNIAKIEARYPSGFTTADSIARRDVNAEERQPPPLPDRRREWGRLHWPRTVARRRLRPQP